MKNLGIIYGKNRNYKGIDFIDFSYIEKYHSDNLVIKGMDIMCMGETKAKTKEIFNNRLETEIKRLKDAGYDYRDVVHELRYGK